MSFVEGLHPGQPPAPWISASAPAKVLAEGFPSRVLRWFLYAAWANVLFDFHRLVGFGRLDTLISMGVLSIALINGVYYLNRRWRMFPAVLIFLALGLIALPYAANQGTVRIYSKLFFQFWVLGIATFVTLRQVRQIIPLLYMVSLQYLWWFLHAWPSGQVFWHSFLGDTNALASIMVMGAAWCYYFGRGARHVWVRRAATLTAALCLIGMVPAMARGATLALLFLVGVIFMRSPRKGRTAAGLAFGGIVFLIAVGTLLPRGTFTQEFRSIFEQGTSSGTGEDRWIVWGAALKLWQTHPITGIGLGNFSFTVAGHFKPGQLGGMYAANPNRLAGMSIHNDYVQILSETGLLGFGAYLFMLYSYFRNGRRLRSKSYRAIWDQETGGKLDLNMLSLAFEASMTALLINGLFYPQLDKLWFWGLLIVQFSIYNNLRERVQTAALHTRLETQAGRDRARIEAFAG